MRPKSKTVSTQGCCALRHNGRRSRCSVGKPSASTHQARHAACVHTLSKPARSTHRVPGQERREAGDHADCPHAGPPSSVGDAESLVEVKVAHVGADVSGAGEGHLGVHVGSVHVHLRTSRRRSETHTTVKKNVRNSVNALFRHEHRACDVLQGFFSARGRERVRWRARSRPRRRRQCHDFRADGSRPRAYT